jgi:hypothetical protein
MLLAVLAVGVGSVLPAPAFASEILTRNAKYISLKVGKDGKAVVGYKAPSGRWGHPLIWGAVNARDPNPTVKQVHFKIDYSGGWGTFRKPIWKTMKNACQPYDGPPLPWLVKACKAPDGSYWALQRWQRGLPNLGMTPWKAKQRDWELHISHWTGELPVIEVYLDWIYSHKFHHLFGRYTYKGNPVHGFTATSSGKPLDTYGRNLYVDTFNSAYGKGWKRENSFLVHKYRGNFCYGFYKHARYPGYPRGPERPRGHGTKYRWTIMGPGVTPVVGGGTTGLEDYNPLNPAHVSYEAAMNDLGDSIHGSDEKCAQH